MEIYSSIWHAVIAFLVFFTGAVVALVVGQRFRIRTVRSFIIYIWHSVFCLIYLWYVLENGGDAIGYYLAAQEGILEFGFGTDGVNYLTHLLVQVFGVSLLGAFLVFNIVGTVGLLAFDGSLKIAVQGKGRYTQRLASLIVFLPSISFWSSAIGKDALAFMAVGLALWAALRLHQRWVLMLVAIAIMLLARPHMAALMTVTWAFAVLVDKKFSLTRKTSLSLATLGTAFIMVPLGLDYAGLSDGVSQESFSTYIEQRQGFNMEGGGGVNISEMSFPVQLVTYMFRPSILEANAVFSLAAGIDNLILFFVFVAGAWALIKNRREPLGESRVFLWAYSLISWGILAIVTANLGISIRQKWMFLPMLLFLIFSAMGSRKLQPINRQNYPVSTSSLRP
jgi:hypothetical protein